MKKLTKTNLQKIFGGDQVQTEKSLKIDGMCGSSATFTVTDSFDDKNGDGVWGPGESGTKTTTVVFN